MDVKQILAVYVRVNEDANRKLYKTLAGSPAELLVKPGGYFRSVMGTLNHILVSELGMLQRFRRSSISRPVLESPLLEFTRPAAGELFIADFAALRKRREEVDSLLREYVDELDDSDLATEIVETGSEGASRRWIPAFSLLHLMNHATHHRGQISQVLDEAGIEHDFSGILQAMRRWD